jgi:sulfopyruvate decarboxylase beta subunit
MYENLLIEVLQREGIDLVASLPCDRTKELTHLIPTMFRTVDLLREEDGTGICAGVYLAGGRPAMVIQSSGLGNMVNALMSLTKTYSLPLPVIASWRGVYKEAIPAQVPFNRALPRMLKALNIPFHEISDMGQFDSAGEAIRQAYERSTPFVILVKPSCWEGAGPNGSGIQETFPGRSRTTKFTFSRMVEDPVMTRLDAIKAIAPHLGDASVVSNIGIPGKELYHTFDRPLNFYMLGSYTQASPIGLGLSLTNRRRTIVLDGDGSILGTAVLPVIAQKKPRNLTIVCLDNGTFGSTGNQMTPAYLQVDLELYARACGFENTGKAFRPEEIRETLTDLEKGPSFLHVVLKPGNSDVPNIPLSPLQIRDRFMAAVGNTY